MKMTIENMPSCPIAYIRNIGAYGANNIQAMTQIKHWAETNGLMDQHTVILGIAHDDPLITPSEKCRYDACIIVPNKSHLTTDKMQYSVIAGGNYAVFTIAHTAEAMAKAWNEIFPALSLNALLLDPTRPILERYTTEKVAQHLCEICIPLV